MTTRIWFAKRAIANRLNENTIAKTIANNTSEANERESGTIANAKAIANNTSEANERESGTIANAKAIANNTSEANERERKERKLKRERERRWRNDER